MNSNPTTLSVDEQIDTRTLRLKIIDALAFKPKIGVYLEQIENVESLIRQVCEEVINRAKLVTGTQFEWGNFRSEDDMKRELNKMLGKGEL